MSHPLAQNSPSPRSEYPQTVSWLLRLTLWGLMLAAGWMVFSQWEQIPHLPLFLYGGVVSAYLIAERRAYRGSPQNSTRANDALRYWLAFFYYLILLGAPLFYTFQPRFNLAFSLAGALLALAGTALRVWSVATLGSSFSGHIETWPNQALVTSGPYRFIRHPAYAGSILQTIGLPLILNAWPLLLGCAVLLALFVRRIQLEEIFLNREFPGYQHAMQSIPRLIPGIW